jgi:HrpA-like RNA helicase
MLQSDIPVLFILIWLIIIIKEVTHIILDDFHERHEDSDILIVLLRQLIKE